MTPVSDAGGLDVSTGSGDPADAPSVSPEGPDARIDVGIVLATPVVAAVAGIALLLTARAGGTPLLIAVALAQAALVVTWTFATAMPGRLGGLVIGAFAAAGADVTASVWPHGHLGALVAVLGLAVPVMYAHQLWRGAARADVVASLSGIALLVLLQVALASYLQLRHEFPTSGEGGRLAAACIGAVAAAIIAGALVDLVLPWPRFDERVARGVLGVVVGAVVAGAVGYLLVRDTTAGRRFDGGRALFAGAALGTLAGLLSIGVTFVRHSRPATQSRLRQATGPLIAGLVPIAALAPVAFVLCLAVRR